MIASCGLPSGKLTVCWVNQLFLWSFSLANCELTKGCRWLFELLLNLNDSGCSIISPLDTSIFHACGLREISTGNQCLFPAKNWTGAVRLEMTLTWTLMRSTGARRRFFLRLDEATTRWCPGSLAKLVYHSNDSNDLGF